MVDLGVSEQAVRDYLTLNVDSTSRYTDATIGSNIRAAAEFIERATNRYFANRLAMTYLVTTEGAAGVTLPGLRTATTVTLGGTVLAAGDDGYHLLPDAFQTGVYIGMQFRPYGTRYDGPAYLGRSDWFDRNLDSPKWPGNWGSAGGSLPNDLSILGDWGYTDALMPEAARQANKVLAAYFTIRPQALLSGASISPDGSAFDLSDFPPEFRRFVDLWRLGGRRIVTVG